MTYVQYRHVHYIHVVHIYLFTAAVFRLYSVFIFHNINNMCTVQHIDTFICMYTCNKCMVSETLRIRIPQSGLYN